MRPSRKGPMGVKDRYSDARIRCSIAREDVRSRSSFLSFPAGHYFPLTHSSPAPHRTCVFTTRIAPSQSLFRPFYFLNVFFIPFRSLFLARLTAWSLWPVPNKNLEARRRTLAWSNASPISIFVMISTAGPSSPLDTALLQENPKGRRRRKSRGGENPHALAGASADYTMPVLPRSPRIQEKTTAYAERGRGGPCWPCSSRPGSSFQ